MRKSVYHISSLLIIIATSMVLLSSCGLWGASGAETAKNWVGTWAAAPQLVEPHNMPPEPGLTKNSLRQVVRVSIGGDTIRVMLSNEFGTSPVTMNAVEIAVSTGGHTIDGSTTRMLTFEGIQGVAIDAGDVVVSDPVAFHLAPRMDVAITIYYGQTPETVTGHPGSRTTSYILSGNTASNTAFSGAVQTDRWYHISRVDVLAAAPAACVAILGNSITDGRGSTTNEQNRWPDVLSERLLQNPDKKHIGVLNMGIGGNAVLAGGLGPTAMSRYERDILDQPGIKWAIVFHGVNDIGGVRTAEAATAMAEGLIAAYRQMITEARERGIKVYGATIMPFKGNAYYNDHSERCRQLVNAWIRGSDWYDAVIDFDMVMQDPHDHGRLVSSYQDDGLHPDAAGYKRMGDAVDLSLFQ